VAPAAGERRAPLLADARARLAEDGIAYLLVPPPRRTDGLALGPVFAHLPHRDSSRHLVPASRAAVRYALSHLAAGTTLRGRLAAALPAVGAGLRLLPGSGAVARRSGSLRPLAWLREHAPSARLESVVVSTSASAVVLRVVDPGVFVKLGELAATEADALAELGPAARAAGAAVPEPLRSDTHASWPLLVQSAIPGRPASLLLGRRPAALGSTVEAIVDWLDRWNRATAQPARLDRALLERELLGPAAVLAPELPNGSAYLEWLALRAAEAEGTTMPLVAAHRDLTMANVLLGDGDRLGVVDWAAAAPRALPLADLFYAVVDAQAAADRYADPAASFAACFGPGGLAGASQARLAASLGLDEAAVELCFHACWLGHTKNEAARPEGTRPFLRILRQVSERR
jgi:aminoglycoside phosphotransferase